MPTHEEWIEYEKPGGPKDQGKTIVHWKCASCGKDTNDMVHLAEQNNKLYKVCSSCFSKIYQNVPDIEDVLVQYR